MWLNVGDLVATRYADYICRLSLTISELVLNCR